MAEACNFHVIERQNLQTKPAGGKRTWPKHAIFMSKCLEVLTGGRSMPGKCVRDMAFGQLDGCEMGLTLESEEGEVLESEEGEVPHLRWSQAPPRPGQGRGRRIYTYIYIYTHTHTVLNPTPYPIPHRRGIGNQGTKQGEFIQRFMALGSNRQYESCNVKTRLRFALG